MNTLRNSVQLVDNLGRDVEFKNFDSGSSRASFTLSTKDFYKNNKGEKMQDTQWHNVVAWGRVAENMNSLLAKGSEVMIKGKLTSRSYDNKEGEKKYITEIVVNEFMTLQKKELPF